MSGPTPQVAIIGSGLAGLALGLALHQQGIPCAIYESRPAPLNIGGAVMLSPNALRVLDALEMYQEVKQKGYSFETLEFRDADGNVTETYPFGDEAKYGYRGLRIYRHELIDALVAALGEKKVAIHYGKKFSHVVEETSGSVTFAFADGAQETASVLVGADGIHSTVRKYLYPDLQTRFLGMAGITAAVPTAQLRLPEGYHIPVTITTPHGAFVIAPQKVDGSEVLIGKQRRVEEKDRAGWEAALADRAASVRFLQQDADRFPGVVRNAVSSINPDKVNVWPFYVVPKLDRWASERRRVIILGDAAHAIPPSAGQGINQAFEDVYMFALLLAAQEGRRPGGGGSLEAALGFWQSYRQGRVDRILELNKQIDKRRMPADDAVVGANSGFEKEEFELDWLYKPDFKKDVDEWLARQESK